MNPSLSKRSNVAAASALIQPQGSTGAQFDFSANSLSCCSGLNDFPRAGYTEFGNTNSCVYVLRSNGHDDHLLTFSVGVRRHIAAFVLCYSTIKEHLFFTVCSVYEPIAIQELVEKVRNSWKVL